MLTKVWIFHWLKKYKGTTLIKHAGLHHGQNAGRDHDSMKDLWNKTTNDTLKIALEQTRVQWNQS